MSSTYEQLRNDQLKSALSTLLYTNLTDSEIEIISKMIVLRELKGNDILFNEGDKADGAYVLISGRLLVYTTDSEGNRKELAVLSRGVTVGELGVITGEPRTASVMALRDSLLVHLSMMTSGRLIQMYPKMVVNISRSLVSRLTGGSRRTNTVPSRLFVMSASPTIDIEEFVQKLYPTISSSVDVACVTPNTIESMTGIADVTDISISDKENYAINLALDEQELKHKMTILQGTKNHTEWNSRCIRQSDDILLLIDADSKVIDYGIMDSLKGLHVRPVLVHSENNTKPKGSADILNTLKSQRWHHVRKNSLEDLERLVRHILGKSVGLVLSGGGARGLSHLGVFKAIKELNIPIDLIGGTSSGALMASLIALNWETDYTLARARKTALSNPTNDYSWLPFVSVLRGNKFTDILDEYFGGMTIEDFWIPFFCVSSSISKAREVIHTRGSIHSALRASIAIPGVYSPVIIDGEYHVDGGVMNNMPIDSMQSFGAGNIVAVELYSSQYSPGVRTTLPTGWQYLFEKLKGNQEPIPTSIPTVIECTSLGSSYKAKMNVPHVDIHIQTTMSTYGLLDWRKFDSLVADGYTQAMTFFSKSDVIEKITNLTE
jgi:NTE family protein